jgi:hypothetical protein
MDFDGVSSTGLLDAEETVEVSGLIKDGLTE